MFKYYIRFVVYSHGDWLSNYFLNISHWRIYKGYRNLDHRDWKNTCFRIKIILGFRITYFGYRKSFKNELLALPILLKIKFSLKKRYKVTCIFWREVSKRRKIARTLNYILENVYLRLLESCEWICKILNYYDNLNVNFVYEILMKLFFKCNLVLSQF